MTNLITENSIYTNDQEKEAFVSNKQNVATAFWVNLLGMFGLFSFSSKKGLMKTYFQEDGMLRITTITDQNKDLSLLVKLYYEAGGMTMDSANKLTKMILMIKQKVITSKNFNEAEFREIVSNFRWESVRPLPIVQPLIKAFLDDAAPIQTIGKEMYYLVKTRKKEILPYSGEFYTIAKQYIPQMGNVPRLNELKTDVAKADTQPASQTNAVQTPVSTSQVTNAPTPAFSSSLTGYGNIGASSFVPTFNSFANLFNTSTQPTDTVAKDEPAAQPEVQASVQEPVQEPVQIQEPVQEPIKTQEPEPSGIDLKNEKYKSIFEGILNLGEYKEVQKYLKDNKIDSTDFKQWFDDFINSDKGSDYRNSIFKTEESLAKWTEVIIPFITRGGDVKKNEYLGILLYENPDMVSGTAEFLNYFKWIKTLKTVDITDDIVQTMIVTSSNFKNYELKDKGYSVSKYLTFNDNPLRGEIKSLTAILDNSRKFKNWRDVNLRTALREAFEDRDSKRFESLFLTAIDEATTNRMYTFNLAGEFGIEIPAYNEVWEEFEFSETFKDMVGTKFNLGVKFYKTISTNMKAAHTYSYYMNSYLPFEDIENTEESYKTFLEENFGKTPSVDNAISFGSRYNYESSLKASTFNRDIDIAFARALFTHLLSIGQPITTAIPYGIPFFTNSESLDDPLWRTVLSNSEAAFSILLLDMAVSDNFNAMKPKIIDEMIANGIDVQSRLEMAPEKQLARLNFEHPLVNSVQFKEGIINDYSVMNVDYSGSLPSKFVFSLLTSNKLNGLTDEQKSQFVSNMENFRKVVVGSTTPTNEKAVVRGLEKLNGVFPIDERSVDNLDGILSLIKFKKPNINKTVHSIIKNENVDDSLRLKFFKSYMDSWESIDYDLTEYVMDIVKRVGDDDIAYKVKLLETIDPNNFDELYDKFVSTETNSIQISLLRKAKQTVFHRTIVKPYIKKLEESEVEIGFRVNATRMVEILKYNDINLIDFDPNMTIKEAMGIDVKVKDLPIEESEDDSRKLDALSVALLKYRNGRHGDTALRVLKSFNVNMPKNIAGVAEKKEELTKAGHRINSMEPVFHGTGPVAANMILRNGFRVLGNTGAIKIAGRMLGDGIYFSNVIDKAAQYVKTDNNDAFGRRHGTVGVMFEMYALLGRNRIDYKSGATRKLVSPEWVVYDANRQLIIRRAWQVERTSVEKIEELKQNLTESEINDMLPLAEMLSNVDNVKSFDDLLLENEIEKMYKHAVTVRLVREPISDDMISKMGSNVKIDSENSFIVYNDLATFTYEIPLLRDFDQSTLDKMLSGDISELVAYVNS